MPLRDQRGELSLIWCAVGAAILALTAMGFLYFMRYGKNPLGQVWSKVQDSAMVKTLQKAPDMVQPAANTAIQKCTVDGKVIYTNNPNDCHGVKSKAVEIHDTAGFEAPKIATPVPDAANAQMDATKAAIERATR